MRVTVDLDEDILRTAKDLASQNRQTLGQVLSDLVRRGLRPAAGKYTVRNGVPLLMPKRGAKPVTDELVKELLELDD
jgi:hypothetical protein